MNDLYLIITGIATGLISGIVIYFSQKNKKALIVIGISIMAILFILFFLKNYKISISSEKIIFEKNKQIEKLQTPKTDEPFKNDQPSSVETEKKPTDKLAKESNSKMSDANSKSQIQQQNITKTQKSESNNEVEHQGLLKIRVICNSQPITFIGTYVSCAQNKQPELYNSEVSHIDIPIRYDCDIAFINCKINNERWLLDRFTPELKMPNCNIEINGKIISDNYIVKSENGENANYKVRLKRTN